MKNERAECDAFGNEIHVGDFVEYCGTNKRIGSRNVGIVIDIRSPDVHECTVAVKWELNAGYLSDLNGKDPSCSSMWCRHDNIIVSDFVFERPAESAFLSLFVGRKQHTE